MKRGKNNKAKIARYIQEESLSIIYTSNEKIHVRSIGKSYYMIRLYTFCFNAYNYIMYTPYNKLKKRKLLLYKSILEGINNGNK